MKFQSLPDVLQSLLLFFIFVTLIINVYCVVFGIVFRSKKKYKIVNGVLLISTGTLFYIVSLAYYDMHRNYIADEMPSFFTNTNQIIKRNVNKCKTEKMVREDKSKSGKKAEKITKI